MRLHTILVSLFLSLAGGAFSQFVAQTPPWLDNMLQSASPGNVLSIEPNQMPFAPTFNQSPNTLQNGGGTLIYSDDPEEVHGYGILYEDTLPAGVSRLYSYHVNRTASASKVTVVLRNEGLEQATVTFEHRALLPPTPWWINIGKHSVREFYQSDSLPPSLTIPPGGAVIMDPGLETASIANGALINGIHQFTSDQPLHATLLHLPLNASTLTEYESATTLPGDGFDRQGTFPAFLKSRPEPYNWDTTQGMMKFRIADNSSFYDPDIVGINAATGEEIRLRGGYGASYELDLMMSTSDNRQVGMLLSPRGGGYGGFFRVTYGEDVQDYMLPPDGAPSPLIPAATHVGVMAILPPVGRARLLRIEFIPAGASYLPIEIYLVPFTNTGPTPTPTPSPTPAGGIEGWILLGSS